MDEFLVVDRHELHVQTLLIEVGLEKGDFYYKLEIIISCDFLIKLNFSLLTMDPKVSVERV